MKYSGRTVIVTGASKGIGKAIAKKCASFGANIVAVYKSDDKAAFSLKNEIKKNLLLIKADVTKEKDVKRTIEQTLERFGNIDVLVNNVGTNNPKPIWDYKLSEWNEIISSNLTSVFLCTKYAILYLEKSKGVIINISSRAGFLELYLLNQIPYSVSKSGVTKFTVDAAKALTGKNIRVNAVIPTVTKTQRLKIFTKDEIERLEREGKLGTPEEVADLVLELIDDTSANGKILKDRRVDN